MSLRATEIVTKTSLIKSAPNILILMIELERCFPFLSTASVPTVTLYKDCKVECRGWGFKNKTDKTVVSKRLSDNPL